MDTHSSLRAHVGPSFEDRSINFIINTILSTKSVVLLKNKNGIYGRATDVVWWPSVR